VSIADIDWEGFRSEVATLEALLEDPPDQRELLELEAVRILARLYSGGVEIRCLADAYSETGGDLEWAHRDLENNHEHDLWLRRWQRRAGEVVPVLGDHNPHKVPLDPVDASSPGESHLSDDLSDVLVDLMAGATFYDQGRLPEAMREWSFRFDHWGDHALRALQFFLGAMSSQIVFGLAVGVPTLVALRIFGEDDYGLLLIVLVSSGIGAGLCAALGTFIGRRTAAGWPLIVGTQMQPVWVLYNGLFGPLHSAGIGILTLPWAVAGATLAIVYWRERAKRDASSLDSGLSAASPTSPV